MERAGLRLFLGKQPVMQPEGTMTTTPAKGGFRSRAGDFLARYPGAFLENRIV